MKISVIITARQGSGKHLSDVCGQPIIQYPIQAVHDSGLNGFIHTDDTNILCMEHRLAVIPRKKSQDNELHRDTIRRCAEWLIDHHDYRCDDTILIILGNTTSVTGDVLNHVAKIMLDGANSAMTVISMHECDPCRAFYVNDYGIRSVIPGASSNRQDYQETVFWDAGVWATRIKYAIRSDGPTPWTWLTHDCKIVRRMNPFAFDYHNQQHTNAMDMLLKAGDRL